MLNLWKKYDEVMDKLAFWSGKPKEKDFLPPNFSSEFNMWVSKRIMVDDAEGAVYSLACKGSRGIAKIDGTFEFFTDWGEAESRRKDLQCGNPGVTIEIRKIRFTYTYC